MKKEKVEVTADQIKDALARSKTVFEAAKKLNIGYKRLWNLCEKYRIPWLVELEGKAKKYYTGKRTDKAPYRKDDGRDVSCWIDPEERDYYYNLDFLCGTYHGNADRKGRKEPPHHGLGYGEDNEP